MGLNRFNHKTWWFNGINKAQNIGEMSRGTNQKMIFDAF